MIEIRRTGIIELVTPMDIFEQGKRIIRKNGNTKQRTGGYPTERIIKKGIENGDSYVCLNEEQEMMGTFALIQGDDPTYAYIYDGAWADDKQPYSAIHRLTSIEDNKGVTPACL